MRFRDKLARFFYGRNGIDSLYYGLLGVFIFLWLVNAFAAGNKNVSIVINVLTWIVLIYMLYRALSRNLTARRRENEAFKRFFKRVKSFFVLEKNKIRDFKQYRYKKCPSCKASLRLPKRKGSHTVVCPRCGKRFDVNIRL